MLYFYRILMLIIFFGFTSLIPSIVYAQEPRLGKSEVKKKKKKPKKNQVQTQTTASKPTPSLKSLFADIQGQNQEISSTNALVEQFQVSHNSEIYFADETKLSLLILGPTQKLTSAFGHVAIQVSIKSGWGEPDQNWVYDLGFNGQSPSPFAFLFDRPRFEIKKFRYQEIFKYWQSQDRNMIAIPLEMTQNLSGKIYLDLEKLVDSSYLYHPFENNCATQIRDLLDRHLNGQIYQAAEQQSDTFSMKKDVRKMLSASYLYAFVFELFGGIKLEEPKTIWQQSYQGDGLWKLLSVVKIDQKPLLGDGVVLYERQRQEESAIMPWGMVLCVLLGTILLLFQRLFSSTTSSKLFEFFVILLLSLLSIIALYISWHSTLLELRQSLALILFLPTDILAIAFWFVEEGGEESLLQTYFRLRLLFLGVTAILVLLFLGWHALQIPLFFFAFCCLWTAKAQFQVRLFK
jgi:hypothetical protein